MTAPHVPLDISILTHNSARWLSAFVQSLMQQAYPCSQIRLLLRDNGSTDSTVQMLRQIASDHAAQFAQIVVDAGNNVGFGCGHNANLAHAKAQWMLVTNVDLEFEPQTLVELVSRAMIDPQQVASWECRQKPYEHPKHYNPITGDTTWSSSACTLFRVDALRQIGGYEPKLFLYGEDVELSYRLRDRGWQLRYVPRATVWHYTYEHAAEVKPAQFLGSTLANLLLRLRYGTVRDMMRGLLMYGGLFALKPQIPNQRRRLFKNAIEMLRLGPYFLRSRKQSTQRFSFHLWDYEIVRTGAFHEHKPTSAAWRPVVSVLIRTVAGRSGRLAEAVASVVNQTYSPLELVIVEDGSDTAGELAERLRASGRFAAVQYHALKKVGRCTAGNAAMKAATGELLCFLDDDDLFYADHAEVLVDALAGRDNLAGVYGLAYELQTEVISAEPWVYRDISHRLLYSQPFSRALLWHHNYMPIQTVLFRKTLFERYGGLDPELDNLEDWNLWVRYTLEQDFALVHKVTSLYRVPAQVGQALQRQQVLDDYYAKAVSKHSELRVELSPNQVLKMAHELAQDLYLVKVQRRTLRNLVLSRPWLARFYYPLRRAASLLRKLAQRM